MASQLVLFSKRVSNRAGFPSVRTETHLLPSLSRGMRWGLLEHSKSWDIAGHVISVSVSDPQVLQQSAPVGVRTERWMMLDDVG